ncbi:hypothetical protein [Microbulbifer discodermiae]|uniref:hypothetical protein n=1 Tax=Microbulbifer sp. 2201CG32-9 TaxID=3232309 RepID=UPI00345BC5F3
MKYMNFLRSIALITAGLSSASHALINGVDRSIEFGLGEESATVALIGANNNFLCTGAIINEEWILTVADNTCRNAQTVRVDSEEWNNNGSLFTIDSAFTTLNFANTLLLYKLSSPIPPAAPGLSHARAPLLALRSLASLGSFAAIFKFDALTLEGWGERCGPCELSDNLLQATATISNGATISVVDFINSSPDINNINYDDYFNTIPVNFTLISPSPISSSTDAGTLIYADTPDFVAPQSLIGLYSSEAFSNSDSIFTPFTAGDITWIDTTTGGQ